MCNETHPMEDLTKAALFTGMEPHLLDHLLRCIRGETAAYKQNRLIVEEGDEIRRFGLILSGRGRAFKTDSAGRVLTLTLLEKNSEIGVILAASPGKKSPVSVQALEDTAVLWIPFDSLVTGCGKNCPGHNQFLRNYIRIAAEKGLVLHERISCLLQVSVREKILVYLRQMALAQGNAAIVLPLDRYAMSEYLNVERSALSRELSRMKKDGVIDYRKNIFRLL